MECKFIINRDDKLKYFKNNLSMNKNSFSLTKNYRISPHKSVWSLNWLPLYRTLNKHACVPKQARLDY